MKEHFSGPENAHIELARTIGEAHFELATELTRADGPFDHSAGEVIMRCPAVFADRLSPYAFSQLSDGLQQGFTSLADMAAVIKPLSESEKHPKPHESEAAHHYRTTVWQPIHNLQQALLGKEYGKEIEPVMRESVFLASSLFKLGLVEAVSQNDTAVIETLKYFKEKTEQAVRWSNRRR